LFSYPISKPKIVLFTQKEFDKQLELDFKISNK